MARLGLVSLALATLGACAPSGPVVSNEGVRGRGNNVSAAAGPDDAGIAYSGERVVAGVGTDHQAAAGVYVDGSPMVVGVETQDTGGLFGGVGFSF